MIKNSPHLVTVGCNQAFVGLISLIPSIFSSEAKAVGNWYSPYLGFNVMVGLVAFIGLWRMKKWSVILYALFLGINQIVLLMTGFWIASALIIPLAVIIIGFYHFKAMD